MGKCGRKWPESEYGLQCPVIPSLYAAIFVDRPTRTSSLTPHCLEVITRIADWLAGRNVLSGDKSLLDYWY